MSRKRVIGVALVALVVGVILGAIGDRFLTRLHEAAPKIADNGVSAEGNLVPQVRRWVFYENGIRGTITKFDVEPADVVRENQVLLHLRDGQLEQHLTDLMQRRDAANLKANALELKANGAQTDRDAQSKKDEAANQRGLAKSLQKQIDNILAMVDNPRNAGHQDQFDCTVKAPPFTAEEAARLHGQPKWTVLSMGFKERLTGLSVGPSDPLLRLGAEDGPWELEIMIPQTHIGEVKLAFQRLGVNELDVEFHLRSNPARTFQGKLRNDRIASEGSTPVAPVPAYVRIEGEDIDPTKRLPPELRVSGSEIDARLP